MYVIIGVEPLLMCNSYAHLGYLFVNGMKLNITALPCVCGVGETAGSTGAESTGISDPLTADSSSSPS